MQSSISKEQQRGTHVCVRVHVRESSGVLGDGGYGGCSSTGVEENGRRGRAAHREPLGVQKKARGRLAGSGTVTECVGAEEEEDEAWRPKSFRTGFLLKRIRLSTVRTPKHWQLSSIASATNGSPDTSAKIIRERWPH